MRRLINPRFTSKAALASLMAGFLLVTAVILLAR